MTQLQLEVPSRGREFIPTALRSERFTWLEPNALSFAIKKISTRSSRIEIWSQAKLISWLNHSKVNANAARVVDTCYPRKSFVCLRFLLLQPFAFKRTKVGERCWRNFFCKHLQKCSYLVSRRQKQACKRVFRESAKATLRCGVWKMVLAINLIAGKLMQNNLSRGLMKSSWNPLKLHAFKLQRDYYSQTLTVRLSRENQLENCPKVTADSNWLPRSQLRHLVCL